MTNEEKADEICKRHIFDSNHYDCCMEMAEWKDSQLKDYLEDCVKAAEDNDNSFAKELFKIMLKELGL